MAVAVYDFPSSKSCRLSEGRPSEKRRRASVHTLGCRLNQSESQLIKDSLVGAGYDLVPFGESADLGIINTCTVTSEADSKCRQAIRKFIRRNPHAFTAVVGCYSQMAAMVIAEIQGVDLIVGNQEKLNVHNYVGSGKTRHPVILVDRMKREDFSISGNGVGSFEKRANLKIQDGCDFMCGFCIIPHARGRARSRRLENLMEEVRSLAQRGVRELILTGVNLGTYDQDGRNIVSVVDALDERPEIRRIRISSIEPTTIPFDLLERMADPAHALLPYLHIPLQSGSDRVLKRMRRRYSVAEFVSFIRHADSLVKDLCIGTDLLVGSPGEEEDDFLRTCRVFSENPFAYCHVFPYSRRDKTLAAKQEGHVPDKVKAKRSAICRRLGAARKYDYKERYLGQVREVLFEDQRDGYFPGYTENYIRVVSRSQTHLTNRLVRVRLDRIRGDFVEGSVVKILD